MIAIFTIPNTFVASTTAVMSEVFNDLSTIIVLIIGVLLAVVVIEIIIHAIRPK